MTTFEALELLGYKSIDNLTIDDIQSNYKKLARKHHPDLYQSSDEQSFHEDIFKKVNEARKLLIQVISEIDKIKQWEKASHRQEIFAIIPFEELFSLYNGESIELKSSTDEKHSDDSFILTKSNIRSHRIILYIECIIMIEGVEYKFNRMTPATIKDDYEINCKIEVPEDRINDPLDLFIKAAGKELRFTLTTSEARLKFRYDNNVVLSVGVSKKALVNKEDV